MAALQEWPPDPHPPPPGAASGADTPKTVRNPDLISDLDGESKSFQEIERILFYEARSILRCAKCAKTGTLSNHGIGGNRAQGGYSLIQLACVTPGCPKMRLKDALIAAGESAEMILKKYLIEEEKQKKDPVTKPAKATKPARTK